MTTDDNSKTRVDTSFLSPSFFFFFLFIKESDLLFLLSLKTFHGFLEKWYQPPGPKFKSDESWSLDGRLYNSTGQSVRCSL